MDDNGIWLSILEYAHYRQLSVSTIRRYIKAGRVKFKKEHGKFLIFVPKEKWNAIKNEEESILTMKMEIQELKNKNKILKEQNAELLMLVQLYENNKTNSNLEEKLPELPL